MTDNTQPEALRALAEAAKWTGKWYDAGCNTVYCTYDKEDSILHDEIAHPVPFGVSGYIAAAHPQAVIALLDRIAELESELESVGAALSACTPPAPAGQGVPGNFITHRASWRKALEAAKANAAGDDVSYWDHELRAFDRSFDRLWELMQASPTPPAEQQAQSAGPCVICGSDEPFTGTCGSGDPRALCKQAAPNAAPGVGNSGFDHKTAADLLNNKTVSDEAVRKFVATSRWAHDERAALSATLLAMHGVLTSREAEIALLKKALLEAEAAPQQEAQEPCPTCAALARTVMLDQVSFDRKPDCYGIRQITDDEGVEEWEDIRTSPDVAREEANDMMATGRGEVYEVVPLWTTPQPAPAPLSDDVVKDAARWRMAALIGNEVMLHPDKRTHATAVKAYMDATHSGSDLTGAVDAAIAAQGGKV